MALLTELGRGHETEGGSRRAELEGRKSEVRGRAGVRCVGEGGSGGVAWLDSRPLSGNPPGWLESGSGKR